MNYPLFSVLIANYNNEDLFIDCYNSILNQTYKNWEIILVDDGSKEESLNKIYEIIKLDSRVKFYNNEKNYGCAYTKKKCIELSNGMICGFVDPDDGIVETAIEIMVKQHLNNPECSLIYSTHYICNNKLEKRNVNIYVKQKRREFLFEEKKMCVHHFATFKKEYYEQTEGLNTSFLRAIDHDLYYILDSVGEVKYIDLPLYYYRRSKNSISLNDNTYKAVYWAWVIRHYHASKLGKNCEDLFSRKYSYNVKIPKSIFNFLVNVRDKYNKLIKIKY